MALYRFFVQQLCACFEGCEFHHLPRANNEAADALARVGSTRQAIPPGVSLEHLCNPSITPSPESDSIVLDADPGTVGAASHPGTAPSHPGTASPRPETTSTRPASTSVPFHPTDL